MSSVTQPTENDRQYLRRCLDLAREALENSDEPFGSLLIDAQGQELFADRNRVSGGDHTRHPEFAIARWAAQNLSPEQRHTGKVYTCGGYCAMCTAGHALVGLGRIVCPSSSAQLAHWHHQWDIPAGPEVTVAINDLATRIEVASPD